MVLAFPLVLLACSFLGWHPTVCVLENKAELPIATLAKGLHGFHSEVGVIIPHLKFGLD